MHDNVKKHLIEWYNVNKTFIDNSKVADLGSYNINGGVKDIIVHSVGFDIYNGLGVDVIIKPGIIPKEHIGKYSVVTCVSSFQFCPEPFLYKKQMIDLLCEKGLLFLTMCSDKCPRGHSSSPNEYKFGDEIRMSLTEIENFFKDDFKILELKDVLYNGHPDIILKAIKK